MLLSLVVPCSTVPTVPTCMYRYSTGSFFCRSILLYSSHGTSPLVRYEGLRPLWLHRCGLHRCAELTTVTTGRYLPVELSTGRYNFTLAIRVDAVTTCHISSEHNNDTAAWPVTHTYAQYLCTVQYLILLHLASPPLLNLSASWLNRKSNQGFLLAKVSGLLLGFSRES